MTYESHTVRSLRRDPIQGETVRLVLTVDEGESASGVSNAVESLGGEVVRKLEFDRLLIEIEQSDIGAVVELDDVTAVETDAVLGPT